MRVEDPRDGFVVRTVGRLFWGAGYNAELQSTMERLTEDFFRDFYTSGTLAEACDAFLAFDEACIDATRAVEVSVPRRLFFEATILTDLPLRIGVRALRTIARVWS